MSIDLIIHDLKGYDLAQMHFEGELRMMNRLADSVREGVIVAIGSFRGQMDCALALHAHGPVYCIDPRQSWPDAGIIFGDEDRVYWMTNVLAMNVAAKVRPIELPSLLVASIWAQRIGLLFIDGNHADAKADFEAWWPHVLPGGLVAFHDFVADEVSAAFADRQDLTLVEQADVTVVFRKEANAVKAVEVAYERYEYNGLALDTRSGVYSVADKHAVQEVQSYPLPNVQIQAVIDAGAHIGAFTAWIKLLHPAARVMAIEVEADNFALLEHNVGKLPGVTTIHAPLAYDLQLSNLIVDPINSGGHHLSHDYEPGQISVQVPPAVTLDALVFGDFASVDLLKLDIEGAEVDVLMNASAETLSRIYCIIGERHVTSEAFAPVVARLENLGFFVDDGPHPELSVPPWNMQDRGIFMAINQNWDLSLVKSEEAQPVIDIPDLFSEDAPPKPKAAATKVQRRAAKGKKK